MSNLLLIDGGLRLVDSDDITRDYLSPLNLSSSRVIDEVYRGKLNLASGAVGAAIPFDHVIIARHAYLNSDVVLRARVNGGSEDIEGSRILLQDAALSSMVVDNLGLLVEDGLATGPGSSTDTIANTSAQWTYAQTISERTVGNYNFDDNGFTLLVNGRQANITFDGVDRTGTQMAALIQTAIDTSAIGPSQVVVAYDTVAEQFTYTSVVSGDWEMIFSVYLNDLTTLDRLGLVAPTVVAGGDPLDGWRIDLIAGTGAGQTRTIASNTSTEITVTLDWVTAPDNTSYYRLYKPQVGVLDILLAN